MSYSNEEAFNMLMILGETFQNYSAAARLYSERYPDRIHHSRNVFQRLAVRVRQTGCVQPLHNKNKQIPRPIRDERTPDIVAAVLCDPEVSTRRLAQDSGVSQSSVSRILKENKLHPYHISLHQEITDDDFVNRLAFCTWAMMELEQNVNFFKSVLWSDEATFRSNGHVNRHNMHYWSHENPHWLRTIDNQRYWTLNTWCGIIGDEIIGPYFFEENLSGQLYEDFLRNELPNLLQDVMLERRMNMWFMHDGCPAHFHHNVRNFLNEIFAEKWIGRGGPVPWPARSPDLTCIDYYLWGKIKALVYVEKPTTREDMKGRIRRACQQIPKEEILRVTGGFSKRLEKCMENDGKHFEHLL